METYDRFLLYILIQINEWVLDKASIRLYVCERMYVCRKASRGVSQLICHHKTVCDHRERERERDWHKLISTLIPLSDSTIYYKGLSEQTNEKKAHTWTSRKREGERGREKASRCCTRWIRAQIRKQIQIRCQGDPTKLKWKESFGTCLSSLQLIQWRWTSGWFK